MDMFCTGPTNLQAKRAVKDIFNSGSNTGRKVTPEEASNMLREGFQDDESAWLRPSQVTLFIFSQRDSR